MDGGLIPGKPRVSFAKAAGDGDGCCGGADVAPRGGCGLGDGADVAVDRAMGLVHRFTVERLYPKGVSSNLGHP